MSLLRVAAHPAPAAGGRTLVKNWPSITFPIQLNSFHSSFLLKDRQEWIIAVQDVFYLLFKVASISLHRCHNETSVTTCVACVELQDPYCAWSLTKQRCVPVKSEIYSPRTHHHMDHAEIKGPFSENVSMSLIQDVHRGSKNECPKIIDPTTEKPKKIIKTGEN